MRLQCRALCLSAGHIRNTPFTPLRVSFVSYRNFQSLTLRQESAEVTDDYRPRRYDVTGSVISPSQDFDTKRRTFDRYRPSRGSDGRRGIQDTVDRRRIRDKYDVRTYIDEDGNKQQLHDDAESLPEYNPDSEHVKVSDLETQVTESQFEGYKPVRWLEYRGKIDDGFLQSMKTIFRYAHLTEVQHTIISRMPLERDLLVRSKTGTGKTLAFLIPAMQRHIDYMKKNNLNPKQYPKTHTGVLIISPTRELAMQIASEARRLIYTIQPSGMKVQVLVGGESKRLQIRRMDRERNDVIVATPGRLLDFLGSEPGVRDILMSIKTLILDETDSLLDMGFRQDIIKILGILRETEKDRMTMMFSATISPEVKNLATQTVKRDVEFINTVKPTDLDVHQTITQSYIIHDMGEHIKIILSLIINEQLNRPGGKVIVFFNTTKQVQLYTMMFRYLRRLYYNPHFQQFEIHSRKAQDARSKVTQAFRSANVGSVLFTTDVSARGVDYPGVTKVIQVGAPLNRDIYIHRIGRTGRAGKSGDATLILAPFEKPFLDELTDIPIKDHELPASEIEVGPKERNVLTGAQKIPPEGMVEETFLSLLGYYLPKVKSWGASIERAMSEMENWTLAMGAPAIPQVSKTFLLRIVGKPKALDRNVMERRSRTAGHKSRRGSYGDSSRFYGDNRGVYERDSRGFDSGRSRGHRAPRDRRGGREY